MGVTSFGYPSLGLYQSRCALCPLVEAGAGTQEVSMHSVNLESSEAHCAGLVEGAHSASKSPNRENSDFGHPFPSLFLHIFPE